MREWYSAKELLGVGGLPTSKGKLLQKAKRQGWQSRKRQGRGGGKEYHFNSLPEATQAALLLSDSNIPRAGAVLDPKTPRQAVAPATLVSASGEPSSPLIQPPVAGTLFNNYDRDALWHYFDSKPEKQKQKARARLAAIQTALSLIKSGTKQTKAWKLAARTHAVHYYTLRYRWYESLKRYHQLDWLAALLPGYVGRQKTAECSETAWSYFIADYLRLEQPALTACYRRLQRAAAEHGWTIPSVDTFARKVKREVPFTVRLLKRKGYQALYHLYPPLKRSVREMCALQAINGDGYEHNVFVKWPDGTIARPRTWFWQDIYSRKLLSYRTDKTENTDLIRLSFGDLVEQFGVPEHVTIDNTRAAANKWMSGGVEKRHRFKVKEEDPLGLFPTLGINVHWTSVVAGKGSGQSKPVERAFGIGGIGEVVDKHPALVGCYTGPNTQAKPENYASRAISLEDFLHVLEQEVLAFNTQPKRRSEMAAGVHSFDQVFNRSYQHSAITKPTEAQRRLWLLAAEAVTVQRNGTVTLDAGKAVGIGRNRYRADALYELQGQKVIVRFDPQALQDEVHIYQLNGTYLCPAVCVEDAGFYDTRISNAHNRERKRFVKATKDAATAHERMTAIEASKFLPKQDAATAPEVKVVRQLQPKTKRKARPVPEFSAADRAKLAAEIETLSNIEDIETDRMRYFRWCAIDDKPAAERSDLEKDFYESFQKTSEWRVERDICNEFGLTADGV